MGTGVSTAPGDDDAASTTSDTSRSKSRSISRSYPTTRDTKTTNNNNNKQASKLKTVLKSIRHAGGSFKRKASERCHKFEKSYYKRRDPQYIDYSVYGEDEDANDPDDSRVYQLKRTRAWHEKKWFNMAAFNERLAKDFNATKKNFRVYYNKLLKGSGKSAAARQEKAEKQKVEDQKWKEFFVKTQDQYDKETKAHEEEKRRQAEEAARKPEPKVHPCTNMTMEERVVYYEDIFHFTLRRAPWVQSPTWRSLEVPRDHRKQLAGPTSSSSSEEEESSNSEGEEEDSSDSNCSDN